MTSPPLRSLWGSLPPGLFISCSSPAPALPSSTPATLDWTCALVPLSLMSQVPLISVEIVFLTHTLNQVFPLRHGFTFKFPLQESLFNSWKGLEAPKCFPWFPETSGACFFMLFSATSLLHPHVQPWFLSSLVKLPNPFSTQVHTLWAYFHELSAFTDDWGDCERQL